MDKKEIEVCIKSIFNDLFDKPASEVEYSKNILCGDCNLKARDLVYLMVEVEKHFAIQFTQENIDNKDLFTLCGIVNAVGVLLASKTS